MLLSKGHHKGSEGHYKVVISIKDPVMHLCGLDGTQNGAAIFIVSKFLIVLSIDYFTVPPLNIKLPAPHIQTFYSGFPSL
jgi:hypothetical protein